MLVSGQCHKVLRTERAKDLNYLAARAAMRSSVLLQVKVFLNIPGTEKGKKTFHIIFTYLLLLFIEREKKKKPLELYFVQIEHDSP